MYILNTGKKYKYREEIFIPIPHQHIKIRKMPAWNADTMKNLTAIAVPLRSLDFREA